MTHKECMLAVLGSWYIYVFDPDSSMIVLLNWANSRLLLLLLLLLHYSCQSESQLLELVTVTVPCPMAWIVTHWQASESKTDYKWDFKSCLWTVTVPLAWERLGHCPPPVFGHKRPSLCYSDLGWRGRLQAEWAFKSLWPCHCPQCPRLGLRVLNPEGPEGPGLGTGCEPDCSTC